MQSRLQRRVGVGIAAAIVGSLGSLAAIAEQTQLPLNHNFNGLLHGGEAGQPDNPDGFRSISDRALVVDGAPGSFGADPIVGRTGLSYAIVTAGAELDIVHLGDRNTVNGGGNSFDGVENGDNWGIQPNWLPDTNQTGSQMSAISPPITLDATAQIGLIYQISNGGGNFDVVLGFVDGGTVAVTVHGPDWFQNQAPALRGPGAYSQQQLGVYNGAGSVDMGTPDAALNVAEAVITAPELIADGLGDVTGRQLNSITFEHRTNTNAGYAIIAASVETAVASPANNECAAATPVGEGTFTGANAFGDGADVSLCTTGDTRDVWWVYTPSRTGSARIRTCGSDFDTSVAVFNGCGGTQIACNDDACGLQSEVIVGVQEGVPVVVRVSGWQGAVGQITLSIANPAEVAFGPIENPANGNSYLLLFPNSWTASEATAVALGGHLATVRNFEENEWLRVNMLFYDGTGRSGWLGLNDVDVEGDFRWVSGEAVEFTNWNGGEPNNAGGVEDFTQIVEDGFWNDNRDAPAVDVWGIVEIVAPASLRGDANCDSFINFDDIDCFVSALIGEAAWDVCGHGAGCDYVGANDIDQNSAVNFDDIEGFVECLIFGACP